MKPAVRSRIRRGLLAALSALAVGAGPSKDVRPARTGGDMTVQLTKVGKLEPTRGGSDDTVDHIPLVLWAGTEPSAVIAYRKVRHLLRSGITQEFVALGPRGTWDVSHRMRQAEGAAPEGTDMYVPSSAAAADVDGDGVQELVLVRNTGAVEVWRNGKKLGAFAGPGESRAYSVTATSEAILPGRDELYVLFDHRPAPKAPPVDPYLLVRVGGAAPSRIVLQGLPPKLRKVMAVGPLNLPGSKQVDELLVISLADAGGGLETYLSRHGVDGTAIGVPRKIYQPFDIEANPTFAFVPQSDRAVALSPRDGHVLFFAPAKPANWLRSVDLGGLARESYPVRWFGISEAGAAVKAVVRREDALYAVDEEGRFQALEGGRWVARKEAKPFYQVEQAGSPETGAFDLVGVFPARGSADEFLVVQARHQQARGLSDEERTSAAKRFLSAERLESVALYGKVRMDPDGEIHEREIQKELAERASTEQVKTVEDWKRLAPRSYAAAEEKRRERYQGVLSDKLFDPLDGGGKIPEDCPDPNGYRAWLHALTLPSKTVGTLVRRETAIASFEFDAIPPPDTFGDVAGPIVSYRAREGDVTAVLPIAGPPDSPAPGGFYVVHASKGTR
jgi:hypothetical protein